MRLNRPVCSLKERDGATKARINATLDSHGDECPFERAEDQPQCPWYEKPG